MVVFFLFSLLSKFMIVLLFFEFRLLVGLFINKMFGLLVNVWVMVICCC